MYSLTREDAIKRVNDIRDGIGTDHLTPPAFICEFTKNKRLSESIWQYVAEAELRAIFDINEEELK